MLHNISTREKLIIMLAVMSGLFLASLDQTIVGTALPRILSEFNALQQLSWVITAYLLTSTIAVPISGKLSDIYGRRRLLLIGITIFVASSALCGLSQNIWQLIVFRALQGIGGGVLFANAFTIIGDLFPSRERGKWQGIIGAVFGLASVVGPLLGGYLTDTHTIFGSLTTNWRWTFYINVPVGLISFGLIARYLPGMVAKERQTIDFLGAGLLSASLAALITASTLGGTPDWAWGSWQIITLLGAGVATLVGFIFAERAALHPILPLSFFKNVTFNLISFIAFMFGAAAFTSFIYIPLFAQEVLGYSATNSGIILLPMIAGLTISSIIGGRIVAKAGTYKVILITGMLLGTLGIGLLGGITQTSTYGDLAWRMAIAGFGFGLSMPLLTLIVQNSFAHNELGVASSSVQLFRSVGSTIGIAALGGILNNVLAQKLGDIHNDKFVQLASAHGKGELFAHLDVNSLQRLLSDQAARTTMTMLNALPSAARTAAVDAFHTFTATLKGALASSIALVFIFSAILFALGLVTAFFVKEVPLRHHEDTPPPIE